MADESLVLTEEIVDGSQSDQGKNTLTGTAKLRVSESVATAETDYQIIAAIDFSALTLIYIKSTQDVLLETNDGTTPDNTIELKAGVPYIWHTESYHALLLTADVTSIFITNVSGATAEITIRLLTDATP